MARGIGEEERQTPLRTQSVDPLSAPERVKYPRTHHMVTSPGFTSDDLRATEDIYKLWEGREISISAKLDGENTNMSRDAIWARSLDGYNFGPAAGTRDWMRRFWSQVRYEIPEGWRISGENMYATHSLHYTKLPSYFFLFAVWDDKNRSLSVDETKEWADLLGVQTAPVLWRGVFDRDKVENMWPYPSVFGESEPEGYVARLADEFAYEDFATSALKWVRSGHVTTSDHWSHQAIIPNELAPDAHPWPGFRKQG